MLRKARKVIPREACVILYDSMILPLFDYCVAVWDGCGKTNRDYLDKLQRRAASIIEKRRVEQGEIYSTLGWLSLQSRRKYQVCLQVFKCLNNLEPVYLLNELRFSSDIHNYNTRNKDLVRVPRAKTTKYQSSFRCNGAKLWNTLPANIRKETTLSSFKLKIKTHLATL